ncbi:hypothetical protein [Pragia fontium]|uniref:hypothetical protein n=1 Tax=Pragia fontium TaxID=82985 RepID=UPI000F6D04CA|nr:hypothetical protein [Pragia fontium]VEJ56330.1 Uncharacterised protein [Pragia fontium]
MVYRLPNYITHAKINKSIINYSWDDSDVDAGWDYSYSEKIATQIESVSLRAKICLMIGTYEWILGRFQGMEQDPIFMYIAEAAWCANINKFYLIPQYELDEHDYAERSNYLGPIAGVLWCSGYSSLMGDLYVSDNTIHVDDDSTTLYEEYDDYYLDSWREDLKFLITATLHILPTEKVSIFKQWLEGVVQRLVKFYTLPEQDPFANLFGNKDEKSWLGDYVAIEILNLKREYDPTEASQLLNQFLSQVNRNNPLLASEQALKTKFAIPYQLGELS